MNEQEMNQQPNPFYLLIDRQIDAISDPSPLYRCSKGLWVETTHIVKEKNKVKDEVNENSGKKKNLCCFINSLARKFGKFLKVNQLDHTNLGALQQKRKRFTYKVKCY